MSKVRYLAVIVSLGVGLREVSEAMTGSGGEVLKVPENLPTIKIIHLGGVPQMSVKSPTDI